jgi:hypothetical protein
MNTIVYYIYLDTMFDPTNVNMPTTADLRAMLIEQAAKKRDEAIEKVVDDLVIIGDVDGWMGIQRDIQCRDVQREYDAAIKRIDHDIYAIQYEMCKSREV